MSNKQWRKPANAQPQPTVDPSTPKQEPAPEAEPAPAAAARSCLTDQQAIDILDLGTKFLHNFLGLAIDSLARMTADQVKRVAAEEPETPYATPQQRPRGRMHGILLLFKYGIAASALVPRLLKCTHPHLFPAEGNRAKAVSAAERFTAAVKKAMPQMVPESA